MCQIKNIKNLTGVVFRAVSQNTFSAVFESYFFVIFQIAHGIGIAKEFWGLGIGRALTEACIECAGKAGYTQLELEVMASNFNAVALYKNVGFTEYGRNPRGFNSRTDGYRELIYMKLEM